MKRRTVLVVLASLVALAGTAVADETTFCNFFITSLPYTISTQGHYCFNKNLSTAITSGNAITVNSDFVVIDLNNFKLGGGSAGLGTAAIGIHAIDRQNITVRNGNIRGFRKAIWLENDALDRSGGHLIENNILDSNTQKGAEVDAGDVGSLPNVLRNNTITNTGGSTVPYYNYVEGIDANGSSPSLVQNNFVTGTYNISTYQDGIDNDGFAVGNSVYMDYDYSYTTAIHNDGICRDNNMMAALNGFAHSCGSFHNVYYNITYPYLTGTRKSETRAPRQ